MVRRHQLRYSPVRTHAAICSNTNNSYLVAGGVSLRAVELSSFTLPYTTYSLHHFVSYPVINGHAVILRTQPVSQRHQNQQSAEAYLRPRQQHECFARSARSMKCSGNICKPYSSQPPCRDEACSLGTTSTGEEITFRRRKDKMPQGRYWTALGQYRASLRHVKIARGSGAFRRVRSRFPSQIEATLRVTDSEW